MFEQILPAIIFAAIVFFFLAMAAYSLAILLYRRLRGIQEAIPPSRQRWMNRFLAIGLIGSLCVLYGRFIEPHRVQVSHVTVQSEKIKPGLPPLRIIHISDLHSEPEPLLEERLPALIAAEKPDLIVFTGDSVNSPAGVPVFRRLMVSLAAVAPTYAVRGNWDIWPEAKSLLFAGTGVTELDAQAVPLQVKGHRLLLVGTPTSDRKGGVTMVDAADHSRLLVFLFHDPAFIYPMADRNVDMFLTGHTHGGQVALPFYGAIITLTYHGKRFEAGLYRVRNTWLYVNRGIGMEGSFAPRVRFWARPEITVIDVVHGTPPRP